MEIIHILPYHYIHVKDKSQNIIKLIEGPGNYIVQIHEQLMLKPTAMITLIPNQFIRITNPVLKKDGEVQFEANFNQAKLRFGDEEIRTYDNYKDPFPLYPGESALSAVQDAKVISETEALRLVSTRHFYDEISKKDRLEGQEWILKGPLVYIDRVEVDVLGQISCTIIEPNSALRLRAKKDFSDYKGVKRISGEEWLVRELGPYIISAEEEIMYIVKAEFIDDTTGLRLKATCAFKDIYGNQRKAGEEWLITNDISSTHIPDVYEDISSKINKTILNRWQYCVVVDPVDPKTGRNQYGKKQLRKGECSFFLQPGEYLNDYCISDNIILSEDEALLLVAKEVYTDEYGKHQPGERWMVYGPRSYVPDIEVDIIEKRQSIPLDITEGIYIRDIHTGEVKMISGTSYLLGANEELWEKELSEEAEILLQSQTGAFNIRDPKPILTKRDKSKVVVFKIPHNSVVQVFDFKAGENHIVFGPDLIKLGPYEQFTILSLSAGTPKEENLVKSLILRLGPDFISDAVEVETSDHARLMLKLTYSWKFDIDRNNQEHLGKLFQVKDFVGDCCKAIASRIRGSVSSVNFDSFHKDSSNIVQNGVFGKDSNGKLKKPLPFKSNKLIITNVDILSQEPIDTKTREILNESMILSMKTNLRIQQSEATHREERANQEANGKVERKKIEDDTEAENKRLILLQLRSDNDQITTCGLAESEAKATCYESEILAESDLEKTKNDFEADKIRKLTELEKKKKIYHQEITHKQRMSDLEVDKAHKLADSTVEKIQTMVNAIGKDTLVEMARAGPDAQASLLKSLGVKSLLVTDGKNPINLFNTANGLIGALPK
jgi:major vault protein